jgi:hypothetical protein
MTSKIFKCGNSRLLSAGCARAAGFGWPTWTSALHIESVAGATDIVAPTSRSATEAQDADRRRTAAPKILGITARSTWIVLLCLLLSTPDPVRAADAKPDGAANGQRRLNVLFIGNSMTWFGNMPRTVAELAGKMDPPAQVNVVLSCQAMNTTPGHAKEGSATRNAIAYKVNKGGTGNLLGMLDHQNYCFQPALTIAWLEQSLAKEPGNVQHKEDILFLKKRMDSLKSQQDPRWDVVVIQPWRENDVEKMSANVKVLQDDLAKAAPGARVILYMDVSGMDGDGGVQTHKKVSNAMTVYRQLALRNGVAVAPAALACLHVNREKPES